MGRGRGDLEVVGSFLRGVTGEDARAHLDDLVRIYRLGLTRPLPMPPKTACTYAEKRRDGKNPDIAIGLGIAYRRTARPALYGAVFVTLLYLVAGTILLPSLWADPLAPLLKTLPILALNFVALAILEDR